MPEEFGYRQAVATKNWNTLVDVSSRGVDAEKRRGSIAICVVEGRREDRTTDRLAKTQHKCRGLEALSTGTRGRREAEYCQQGGNTRVRCLRESFANGSLTGDKYTRKLRDNSSYHHPRSEGPLERAVPV